MDTLHRNGIKTALLFLVLGLTQAVFAATVAERLRDAIAHTAPQLQPKLHGDGGIEIHGPNGTGTVYADNVEKVCEQHADQCEDAIQKFAGTIAAAVTEAPSIVPTDSNIYPVIRSADSLRSLENANHHAPDMTPISHPFTADSVVLYAVDSSMAMRFAVGEDLKKRGFSQERLQAMAAANAARLAPPKVSVLPNSNGLIAAIAQDGYGTSRLFDTNFVQTLEHAAGGPVVVAVPTRDWVLAAKADDAQAVARLRDLAGKIFRGESYAVTPGLVRWDGKAWQPLPP
jgi:uncharacterized protein YtpQ (UPF0354 family)